MRSLPLCLLTLAVTMLSPCLADKMPAPGKLSVADYPSIQAALDANPGQMIFLPPGDYEISKKIVINHDGSGLYGFGRIIQTEPQENIILINKAANVRLLNLTLTRPNDRGGKVSALFANRCENLDLKNLQIVETRAPCGAINLDYCKDATVQNCLVRNFLAVSVEDRTGDKNYGYAYKSLDGTGMQEVGGVGIFLTGNQVQQDEYPPTEETQKKYDLGVFVKKNAEKGALIPQAAWDSNYSGGWYQGSSITINDSESSDYILCLGNYIINGPQGVDIQSDHTTLAQNITNNAVLGMKAMHGSRNTLVLSNQFVRADIHGVLLQPGVSSHAVGQPSRPTQKMDANIDGASIVAHNIVSDFGYGSSNWKIGNERYPYEFDPGQLPDDPALSQVIVEGNMLYNTAKDKILVDGQPVEPPTRYKASAIVFPDDANGNKGPVDIEFYDNKFDPGPAGTILPPSLEKKP